MMSDRKMIYLDDAVEALKNAILSWSDMPEWRDAKIMNALAEVPSAERKGKWIEKDDHVICSECGEEYGWIAYRPYFCENCGARMVSENDSRRVEKDS
jgi:DNA-directed RNA polymerase subunit RPC12/RpoP